MSSSFKSNAITKYLDKLFDDKCLYAKSGSVQRGPGFICGLYIILIIVGFIYNIIVTHKYLNQYGISRTQILLQNCIDIILAIFNIIFIYHMCYICRGFVGFLVLLLINMIIGFIRMSIFTGYTKANIKLGIDQVKQSK
jgi:hypothetical protein